MANVLKMFAAGPIRKTIGRTAALSYPNRREPSVHHKEGRSTAATSHESRPVKPSFCISTPPQRSPHSEVGQINSDIQGLASSWDNYPNTSTRCYTMTRRSNDPARSRPRHQRRHKDHHGHKDEQTPRFRPSSAWTADPAAQPLQAWRPETWTYHTSAWSTAGPARRHGGTLRPIHPHQQCSKHLTQEKTSGTSTSAWPELHDTIPTGKDTSKPADAARRHGGILRPIQPLSHCSKHMTRQKTRNSSTSTWPGLHDIIPLGKDTSRPALPESSRE